MSNSEHSPRQVLLGMFILAQLVFLLVSNLLGFAKWFPTLKREKPNELINRIAPRFADSQGHGWQWTEQLDTNIRCWTDLTGQEQAWSLFAPTVSKETGFPAVLLSWDEEQSGLAGAMFSFDETNGFNLCGPWNHPPASRQPSLLLAGRVGAFGALNSWDALTLHAVDNVRGAEKLPRAELLLSENEPADLQRYFRVGKCRVRKFEGNFYFNPQPYVNEAPADLGTRLNERMHKFLNEYHDFAFAYTKWRLKAWQAANPEAQPPSHVILLERFYRIHDPDEPRGWDGPYVVPMARWRPDQETKAGIYALEPFNFNEHRFIPMTRFR